MSLASPPITLRRATSADLPAMEAIRAAAFAPIFASFRAVLGEEIYELAQRREDEGQAQHLASMLEPDSPWRLFVACGEGESVLGFVSVRLDAETKVAEIGLNAVHPDHAGQGVGTTMYEFALGEMCRAGMRVATVSTGADESHAPARHAYRKAGFSTEFPSVWMVQLLE